MSQKILHTDAVEQFQYTINNSSAFSKDQKKVLNEAIEDLFDTLEITKDSDYKY